MFHHIAAGCWIRANPACFAGMDEFEAAVAKLAIAAAEADLKDHPPPPRERRGDGKVLVRKVAVGRVKGATVVIRPNDHDPPHFHVDLGGEIGRAAYNISTAERREGDLPRHVEREVQAWAKANRPLLEKIWQEKRPTDRTYRL